MWCLQSKASVSKATNRNASAIQKDSCGKEGKKRGVIRLKLDELEKYQNYLKAEKTARRKAVRELKRLERFIAKCRDPHVRSIIIHHYIKGLSWTATAMKVGGDVTGDNCRMMVKRYFKKYKN